MSRNTPTSRLKRRQEEEPVKENKRLFSDKIAQELAFLRIASSSERPHSSGAEPLPRALASGWKRPPHPILLPVAADLAEDALSTGRVRSLSMPELITVGPSSFQVGPSSMSPSRHVAAETGSARASASSSPLLYPLVSQVGMGASLLPEFHGARKSVSDECGFNATESHEHIMFRPTTFADTSSGSPILAFELPAAKRGSVFLSPTVDATLALYTPLDSVSLSTILNDRLRHLSVHPSLSAPVPSLEDDEFAMQDVTRSFESSMAY